MAGSLIQVRIDNSLKEQASNIYENLGIDISTAIRMFLKRTVQENGIPFSMKIQSPKIDNDVLNAMRAISDEAQKSGTDKMSLSEINAEITATRNKE